MCKGIAVNEKMAPVRLQTFIYSPWLYLLFKNCWTLWLYSKEEPQLYLRIIISLKQPHTLYWFFSFQNCSLEWWSQSAKVVLQVRSKKVRLQRKTISNIFGVIWIYFWVKKLLCKAYHILFQFFKTMVETVDDDNNTKKKINYFYII